MAKNGNLLLFETEGDTVVNTFNSDFSKYSDSFRKAFARESFGYLRRDDDRGKRNRKPSPGHRPFRHARAGAPLIKDSENGLLLRFMFFCINSTPEWLDGFSSSGSDVPLVETFDEFGAEFTAFTKLLVDTPQTQLSLSLPQIGMFNDFFTQRKTGCRISMVTGIRPARITLPGALSALQWS